MSLIPDVLKIAGVFALTIWLGSQLGTAAAEMLSGVFPT